MIQSAALYIIITRREQFLIFCIFSINGHYELRFLSEYKHLENIEKMFIKVDTT